MKEIIVIIFLLVLPAQAMQIGIVARESIEATFVDHLPIIAAIQQTTTESLYQKVFLTYQALRDNLYLSTQIENEYQKILQPNFPLQPTFESIRPDLSHEKLRPLRPVDLAIVNAYDYFKYLKNIVEPVCFITWKTPKGIVWVVRNDSSIQSLANLTNKNVLLGEKGSLMGDILAQQLLKNEGISLHHLSDYRFCSMEKNSILSVLNKTVDAAAVSYQSAEKYKQYGLRQLKSDAAATYFLPDVIVIRNKQAIQASTLAKQLLSEPLQSTYLFSQFTSQSIHWLITYL